MNGTETRPKPLIKRALVKRAIVEGKYVENVWCWVCEGWDGPTPRAAWFCWWYSGGPRAPLRKS